MNPDSNPYLQASAQNAIKPVMDMLMQTILPGIGQSAGQAGGFGGTAHANLKGNAISDAVGQSLDMTENMYSNNYGKNLDAFMQALNLGPQQVGMQTMPGETLLNAGGIEDSFNQANLNDRVNRHNFEQTGNMDILDQYLRTLQGFPTTQDTTAESDPSPLDRIIKVGTLGVFD